MKYLNEEKLNGITARLTNVKLGISRKINGRIEAYTMKRAGTDKKYANALGEKYVAEIETMENQLMMMSEQNSTTRIAEGEEEGKTDFSTEQRRKRSQSCGTQLEAVKAPKQQRGRAFSFDVSIAAASSSSPATKPDGEGDDGAFKMQDRSKAPSPSPFSFLPPFSYSMIHNSALGDFCETGTRRLMTDLILTLNASFPDYDFANIRPSDFEKIAVPKAMQRINQSLSELAATKLKQNENFLADLWNGLQSVVGALDSECDVYSYAPPAACCGEEEDPLGFLVPTLLQSDANDAATGGFPSGGAVTDGDSFCREDSGYTSDDISSNTLLLWSFNYFFVNKHKKRIVIFTCIETMQNGQQAPYEDDCDEEYSFVKLHETAGASNIDFDLDPAADVAGGIPISSM